MKGAVQRAKAAFKRMESADDLTHRAVQIIIGKDDDYDAKFNTIKGSSWVTSTQRVLQSSS